MSSFDQFGQPCSLIPINERKKNIVQNSTCFQQELNSEYSIKNINKPNKISSLQANYKNSKEKQNEFQKQIYLRNYNLNNLKDTFQRAHIFHESPLSIKHLDSLRERVRYLISILNKGQIIKSSSVECSPSNGNKKYIYNLNDKAIYNQILKNDINQVEQNQSFEQEFFFTSSMDHRLNNYKQNHRYKNKIQDTNNIKSINIQKHNNSSNVSLDSSLTRDNQGSIKNLFKKVYQKYDNYELRPTQMIMKLPTLKNQFSRGLLKSYRECQNSIENLGKIDKSISQKSIFQDDLSLPENQEKLTNQRYKWENRVAEYINQNKQSNYVRNSDKIFDDNIYKKIYRHSIDGEQKRKNNLIKRLQQVQIEQEQKNFIDSQKRKYQKEDDKQQKQKTSLRELKQTQQYEDQEVNPINQSANIDNQFYTQNRISPHKQQRKQKQVSISIDNKEKQYLDDQILKEDKEVSQNVMLQNKLSSITYRKRIKAKGQQIRNDEIDETEYKLPNFNNINMPIQEIEQTKREQNKKSKRAQQNIYSNYILQEEYVDINSPISLNKKKVYI